VATQDINHPKIEMEGNLVGLEPVTNLGGGGGLKRLRTNQVAILLPAVKEKKGEKKNEQARNKRPLVKSTSWVPRVWWSAWGRNLSQ
jgi:hypothetical protein